MNAAAPLLAIELDDRALAIAADGELRAVAPAVAFAASSGADAGRPAWDVQRAQPTAVSTRHYADLSREVIPESALAVIGAEMRERLAASDARRARAVWFAAPAGLEPRALGAVFGIARELALPVAGFADSAVLASAALGLSGPVLTVDLGLHHVAVSSLDCGERVRRRRSGVSRRGGLLELHEAWLSLVAAAMVRRTRFDPLHEGATEQQLFAQLPALARTAAETGSAHAALEARGERFEVDLSRDQLAQAAQPIYREILRLLHGLHPAGSRLTLLVPQVLLELPGLREELSAFRGCELVRLPEGFAAVAATRLLGETVAQGESVRLLRSLPRAESPLDTPSVGRETLEGAGAQAPPPSHVLFAGRAVAFGEEPVAVGRSLELRAGSIQLPEGLAGISRRHCTFIRQGEEALLVDHSRFGTWVNGERVAGRTRVRAGDRVRIGDPGIELELISVGRA